MPEKMAEMVVSMAKQAGLLTVGPREKIKRPSDKTVLLFALVRQKGLEPP
jgi:hypothetical protein